ncbi:MAG: NifU N-terminal domain-containing protein [Planctomycetota bacterium]
MPYKITRFEETPNPNAIKCLVEPSPGPIPRSYFRAEQADPQEDPLAAALFALPGVASLLIHTEFITVNKADSTRWPDLKRAVEATLAQAD